MRLVCLVFTHAIIFSWRQEVIHGCIGEELGNSWGAIGEQCGTFGSNEKGIFASICQDNKFIMTSQFGSKIRELRTKQKMLLRQLASKLDVDTSIISKVERGDRQLKKEQIPLLADILKTDKEELLTLWLADQVYNIVEGESVADEALKSVSKKIKKSK